MKIILLVLLITIFPFAVMAEEPKAPTLGCCILDKNTDEVYYCMKNTVDKDIYLAVFAKDGQSVIRIAEIKNNGKQDTTFPWAGCLFKTCTITETSCR